MKMLSALADLVVEECANDKTKIGFIGTLLMIEAQEGGINSFLDESNDGDVETWLASELRLEDYAINIHITIDRSKKRPKEQCGK